MATDFYELLGVRRDATDDDLKRAYRKMARELHPDSTGGDAEAEARFKEVTRAYEVLRDPERRARYDRFGEAGLDGQAGSDPFGMGGFGDLFDAFFGGGAGRRARGGETQGEHVEVRLELSFEEAVFGVQREVSVEGPVTCDECAGSGARPGTTAMRCPDCNGAGELRRVRQSILGQVVTATPCRRCRGLGEAITSPCPACHGEGRRHAARTLTLDVPAGVDHGATLRLGGQGPSGLRGGPPGDLFVTLLVRGHERFTRHGDDLRAELHVAVTQAALGASVAFETLDGTEELTVAPGTQSGAQLRLRAKGVPHVRGRGRGDLIVVVIVDTPTELTKEQEELLRRLAEQRAEPVAAPGSQRRSRLRSALG